jgi:hypothetical protein
MSTVETLAAEVRALRALVDRHEARAAAAFDLAALNSDQIARLRQADGAGSNVTHKAAGAVQIDGEQILRCVGQVIAEKADEVEQRLRRDFEHRLAEVAAGEPLQRARPDAPNIRPMHPLGERIARLARDRAA